MPVLRWFTDWRNLTALVVMALFGLLATLVVSSLIDRARALDAAIAATTNEQETRRDASARIAQLNRQIGRLERDESTNGGLLARLRLEVALLERQVRDMGGQPVIEPSSGSGNSPSPTASHSPRPTPRPSPKPSTSPSPSPSPTCVLFICP